MLSLPFGLLNTPVGGGASNAQCVPFSAFDSGPGRATAGLRVTNDGGIYKKAPSNVFLSNYVSSGAHPTIGTEYEIFVSKVSGTNLSGSSDALDTWLTIGSFRAFEYNDDPAQFKAGTFEYQIREIAEPSNISSVCTFNLDTESGA